MRGDGAGRRGCAAERRGGAVHRCGAAERSGDSSADKAANRFLIIPIVGRQADSFCCWLAGWNATIWMLPVGASFYAF